MKKSTFVTLMVSVIVVIDQATKYLISTSMSASDSIEILPFLHIINIRNTGAAFGMFRDFSSSFFIIISFAAIIFVINLIVRNVYSLTGLSMILGGAIGNLIDRLINGKVVDFIDFSIGSFHWPAFNVADSALTVGIGIIIFKSIFKKT